MSGETLARITEDLERALVSGRSQLDPEQRQRAADVVHKVQARTSLASGHTVVALAGATGSGKSSLFNALVGEKIAKIGARRPTTASPTAGIWGDEPVTELLDWLDVGARHHVYQARGAEVGTLNGLVLLDLPDFDSRETSHRVEAERVLELVDVFVWVTDPQKYADARLHDDYVATLSSHDAVTIVVLNQADRLTPDEVRQCSDDLRRLLARDGLTQVTVIPTSATTRAGVEELRQRLANAVAGATASRTRLAGDVRQAAEKLRHSVADREPDITDRPDPALVDALARSAGIPTVVDAVARDYRREAWARTGWPFTRWLRAFRPDPLKRLRLDRGTGEVVSPADVRSVLGRSSLPPATPAARSAVELATRQLGDRAGQGLPRLWSEAASDTATGTGGNLTDALDQAVINTNLRVRSPLWWSVVGAMQLALAFVAVAGLLWLGALAVMGFANLPEIETPRVYGFPYPLIMLVVGLVLGLLLGMVARSFAKVGSRRRARLIDRRLRSSVSDVARDNLIEPVLALLRRHAETRTYIDNARSL